MLSAPRHPLLVHGDVSARKPVSRTGTVDCLKVILPAVTLKWETQLPVAQFV